MLMLSTGVKRHRGYRLDPPDGDSTIVWLLTLRSVPVAAPHGRATSLAVFWATGIIPVDAVGTLGQQ